jgi:hypothetical protein
MEAMGQAELTWEDCTSSQLKLTPPREPDFLIEDNKSILGNQGHKWEKKWGYTDQVN